MVRDFRKKELPTITPLFTHRQFLTATAVRGHVDLYTGRPTRQEIRCILRRRKRERSECANVGTCDGRKLRKAPLQNFIALNLHISGHVVELVDLRLAL